MSRFPHLLALGAAATALASAPAAQAVGGADADVPGSPIVYEDYQPPSLADDSDPGGQRASPFVAPAGSDQDDRSSSGWTVTTAQPVSFDGPLFDGRDAGYTPRPVATSDLAARSKAGLDDGRTAASLEASRRLTLDPSLADVPAEQLDNGRPDGARPAVAAVDDLAAPDRAGLEAPDSVAEGGLSLSAVRPNPVGSLGWTEFTVEAPTLARVTLYDVRGRAVAVAFDGLASPGAPVRVSLDAASLAPGAYVAVLEAGRDRTSRTFLVTR